jgi:hypothetical protein
MGLRFVLALGLGLAAVWPGTTLAVDHLVFGMNPGHTFDIYQNGQILDTAHGSTVSGTVSFSWTGGGAL